ncbi:hypothetical protein KVY11_13680, partial [Acinetobacter sp. CWB-G5]|uniref:hypothetical protein n=1 Tax=Acinetobacter sp. CWB-G5 TaxID=2855444 RepID=UPI001C45D58A
GVIHVRVSHRQLINSNPPNSNEIGGFFYAENIKNKKSRAENAPFNRGLNGKKASICWLLCHI